MGSIDQSIHRDALPDFRNLGVTLRIVCIVLLGCSFAALCQVQGWDGLFDAFLEVVLPVQPALLLSLGALWGANDWLRSRPYREGVLMVCLLELGVVAAVYAGLGWLMPGLARSGLERYWALTLVLTGIVLYYFHLRSRALSPALTEARLQALQARIRPHFLFNSINAVLSLIRVQPRRAEVALEDMADLFRVLMADNRELSTLAREVELTRQYLDLEQLRLGPRLRVEWHVDNMPEDALVPPLVLQPLVENAVYHGIEPAAGAGVVSINAYKSRGEVHLVLRNPYRREGAHHAGNKMALANIRERLSLHFDAEAGLRTTVSENTYQVHIVMPYRSAAAPVPRPNEVAA